MVSSLWFLAGFFVGLLFFVVISFSIIYLGIGYFRKHPEKVGEKVMRPLMKAASKKSRAA